MGSISFLCGRTQRKKDTVPWIRSLKILKKDAPCHIPVWIGTALRCIERMFGAAAYKHKWEGDRRKMKGQVSRERRYAHRATAEMTERAARHTAHTVRIKHWGSAVTIASMTAAMAFPAYADGLTVTDDAIRSMLNSTIDIVFLIFSVGIAVMGAFQLIPAIIHFIQASNSQNGEQRKEAGSGIGTSIMILLLAGLVFMLKTPLKGLVGLGG